MSKPIKDTERTEATNSIITEALKIEGKALKVGGEAQAKTEAVIAAMLAEGFTLADCESMRQALKQRLIIIKAWPMKDGTGKSKGLLVPEGDKAARVTPAGSFYNRFCALIAKRERATRTPDAAKEKAEKAEKAEEGKAAAAPDSARAEATRIRQNEELKSEVAEYLAAARVRISALRREAEKNRGTKLAAVAVEEAAALDGMLMQVAALLGIAKEDVALAA
jgi:hypothetical protein